MWSGTGGFFCLDVGPEILAISYLASRITCLLACNLGKV